MTDLILKGGRVIDPSQGMDARMDVAAAAEWGPRPWGWLPKTAE